ncbi:DNA-directed RNA polymerase subunit alpha [Mycoplasmopsis gallinacea]|uniref:DNA-directed RNA polymerase subunit alpha n=1 Tax=Mycoplasmopsis gallinacea TaxID=29556 RepID=A0A449A2T6_9BACT|nr:DNA-directed RNA polymerase subunit alpha [Mycoplasmopsis gallinacea]VEU58565.1 DNA-directed RNA polymerase, alpha subunit [Mycoplasmopsis gallinacea]
MEKMRKLDYLEIPSIRETNDYETTFSLKNLERGFGNTLGVALRRVLLSSVTSLAPFAVRIEGVEHEFGVIKDVKEDIPQILMNLRNVRFNYNPEIIQEDEFVKVVLNTEDFAGTTITSRQLEAVDNPTVEVTDHSIHIAEVSSPEALKLEIFLRSGRGYVSFEENKKFIDKHMTELNSHIKKGQFIAVDSNFSPIKKVKYEVSELNSSSPKIEEALDFTITTDGTIKAKDALKEACEILIAHFKVIGAVENMNIELFKEEEKPKEDDKDDDININQLNLSVRSLNALKRIGKTKLSEVAELTYEQLEATKNLGKKSLDEIVEKLNEYGYKLREEGE